MKICLVVADFYKNISNNLIKGAAGQAIQNMNLIYNFKENEGLDFNPTFP